MATIPFYARQSYLQRWYLGCKIIFFIWCLIHLLTYIYACKVRTFWEAHKNLRNLPHSLYIYLVNVKTKRKIFSNFVCFSESPNFIKTFWILAIYFEGYQIILTIIISEILLKKWHSWTCSKIVEWIHNYFNASRIIWRHLKLFEDIQIIWRLSNYSGLVHIFLYKH